MADAYRPEFSTGNDRSTVEVVKDIVGNVQEIIRSEIRLATSEMKEKAGQAARSGMILAAGAITGLYAAGFLLVAVYNALSYAVWPWLAAAIVAAALGLGAAVMIANGRKRMKQLNPKPELAARSVKENIEWVRNRKR